MSSECDVASVKADSEHGKRIGITASFENVSDELNTNGETRGNIPDEVSELSVPKAHFYRQPLTHHNTLVYATILPRNSTGFLLIFYPVLYKFGVIFQQSKGAPATKKLVCLFAFTTKKYTLKDLKEHYRSCRLAAKSVQHLC